MNVTEQIREHKVFLKAAEGLPLMIIAIVLLSISTYVLKRSF